MLGPHERVAAARRARVGVCTDAQRRASSRCGSRSARGGDPRGPEESLRLSGRAAPATRGASARLARRGWPFRRSPSRSTPSASQVSGSFAHRRETETLSRSPHCAGARKRDRARRFHVALRRPSRQRSPFAATGSISIAAIPRPLSSATMPLGMNDARTARTCDASGPRGRDPRRDRRALRRASRTRAPLRERRCDRLAVLTGRGGRGAPPRKLAASTTSSVWAPFQPTGTAARCAAWPGPRVPSSPPRRRHVARERRARRRSAARAAR